MFNLGRWRSPLLALLSSGVLAGLFQFNVVRVNYEADSLLAYQGELKQLPVVPHARVERGTASGTVRLIGQGSTPSRALQSNVTAVAALEKDSTDRQKNEIS